MNIINNKSTNIKGKETKKRGQQEPHIKRGE